jgi:Flp pilus assembly protein TadD
MPPDLPRGLPPLLLLWAGCLASPLVHPRAAEELRRGYAHLQAGDPERAEVAFEHALEFAPDLPEGWNGLGVVARSRGDAATAQRRFAQAVRLAPGFAEGHANLGEALLLLERPSEGIEELRAALQIDPDLAAARQNLARALLRQGLAPASDRGARWREARREYLHLLEAVPDSPAAHADLAFMDYLSGRFLPAERGYRRAAELAPTPDRLHGLCLALARLGRCSEAATACERCLALDPSAEPCRVSRRGAEACSD